MRIKPTPIVTALAAAVWLAASVNAPQAAVSASPDNTDEAQSLRNNLISQLNKKLPGFQAQAPDDTAKADLVTALHNITTYVAKVKEPWLPLWLDGLQPTAWYHFVIMGKCLEAGAPYIPPHSPFVAKDLWANNTLGQIVCAIPDSFEQEHLPAIAKQKYMLGYSMLPLGQEEIISGALYPLIFWTGKWRFGGTHFIAP